MLSLFYSMDRDESKGEEPTQAGTSKQSRPRIAEIPPKQGLLYSEFGETSRTKLEQPSLVAIKQSAPSSDRSAEASR